MTSGAPQTVGYIEMEFICGRSLDRGPQGPRDQPMPLDWTAQVLEQLCAVLHEAHGHVDETTGKPKPIIHRDLKPSNLMVVGAQGCHGTATAQGAGLRHRQDRRGRWLPRADGGRRPGRHPAYMSPEQIRGGIRADGAPGDRRAKRPVLHRGGALSPPDRAAPFRGSKMALLAAHLNNAPMPMKEANPKAEVPPEVERVVLQCLEKDPARRPQTARELAEQFRQAAGMGEPRTPPLRLARSEYDGRPPWPPRSCCSPESAWGPR